LGREEKRGGGKEKKNCKVSIPQLCCIYEIEKGGINVKVLPLQKRERRGGKKKRGGGGRGSSTTTQQLTKSRRGRDPSERGGKKKKRGKE